MTKYAEAFKRSVVARYVVGDLGYRTLAEQFGVETSVLREWIALYREHGDAGLAKKHTWYSAEFKLLVLQHMWDNSLSSRQTAAVFNIRNRSAIMDWERSYQQSGPGALEPRRKGRPKAMSDPVPETPDVSTNDDQRTREELLAELKFLRMENVYLKKYNALVQSKKAPTKRK